MGEAKKMSKDGLGKLHKAFGKGAVMQLSDGALEGIERISSGSLYLDSILGGGWPLGRMIEIYGQESSGKSSTCLHLLAGAQKAGLVCGYVDMEMSFVEQDDILKITEQLMKELTEKFSKKKFVGLDKDDNFQRIPWQDAMNKYGTDKPDLRFDLEIKNT